MILELRVKDYIRQMKAFSNDTLSIDKLLVPFGIYTFSPYEPGLMIGFVLEAICEEKFDDDLIDAADVLKIAQDLGASSIKDFMSHASQILYQNLQAQVQEF